MRVHSAGFNFCLNTNKILDPDRNSVFELKNKQNSDPRAASSAPALKLHHSTPVRPLRFAGWDFNYPVQQNIVYQLRDRAYKFPNRVAIGIPAAFTPDGKPVRLNNMELYQGTLQMAGLLKNKFNIKPGDTVSTIETNTPEFFKLFYATLGLGARLAPVNIQALTDKELGHEKLAHMIKLADCKALFLGDTIFRNPHFRDLKKLNLVEPLLKAARKQFIVKHKLSGIGSGLKISEACPLIRKTRATLRRLEYLVENLPTDLPIITPSERDAMLRNTQPIRETELMISPRGDREAVLLYTSGTTSTPKGVPINHAALVHNTEALSRFAHEITADDVQLLGLPMYHIFGLSVYLTAASKGARNIMLPDLVDALGRMPEVAKSIATEKVTFMPVIPKVLNLMLDEGEKNPGLFRTMRFMVSGGQKLPKKSHDRFGEVMPHAKLWEGYGMTEIGIATVNKSGDYGHVGVPISPKIKIELRGKNEQGIGQIWINTPSQGKPYLGLKPEQVREVFQPGGWVNTGDLGMFDGPDLKIVGRQKEIIKRNGEILALDDFDALMNRFLPVRDTITFAYHPNGINEEEKIVSIVLLNDEAKRIGADEEDLKSILAAAAERKEFSYKYMPHYFLPLAKSSFPEGFISLMDKKQHKEARAYLDKLIQQKALRFEPNGLRVLQPSSL